MSYTRVERRTISQVDGRRDYYDVSLVLSTRGLLGSGSAPGSTDPFPHQPPGSPVHWWEGSFLYPEDGGGSSDGVSGQTVSSTNTAGIQFADNTTYNLHVEFAGLSGAYSPSLYINSTYTSVGAIWYEDSGSGDLPSTGHFTHDHTFTTGLIDNVAMMQFQFGSAGDHGHPNVESVHFWVDPDGWDDGSAPTPPAPGQPVNGEVVTMTGNAGTTAWPYAPGSLRLKFNGVTLTPGVDFTETIPDCGDFELTFDPGPAPEIVVWYQGA